MDSQRTHPSRMHVRAQWLQTGSLFLGMLLLWGMMWTLDTAGHGKDVNAIATLTMIPLIISFSVALHLAFTEYERGLRFAARRAQRASSPAAH